VRLQDSACHIQSQGLREIVLPIFPHFVDDVLKKLHSFIRLSIVQIEDPQENHGSVQRRGFQLLIMMDRKVKPKADFLLRFSSCIYQVLRDILKSEA